MQDISTKSKPVLTLSAPAKINLTLEVLGKRSDGYHDIASVIHTISLSDTLTLAPAPKLTFCCDVEELDGSHNLVLQAANMLREEMGVVEGAEISLGKGIPVAVGLGGGRTEAAAAKPTPSGAVEA
ncbi:MAG: 4-(cytidine 5'-diphospho)-2-C-methyl-D-erythritol kinase, partial [Dehalococcoidia bacterium]